MAQGSFHFLGSPIFVVLSGSWQEGQEEVFIPWWQHPQAPVEGSTLDGSSIRQNVQSTTSGIKFVGPPGHVHPLPVVQVVVRTLGQPRFISPFSGALGDQLCEKSPGL